MQQAGPGGGGGTGGNQIDVYVRDSKDNNLGNAKVTLYGSGLTTTGSNPYIFYGVSDGSHTVHVERRGYESADRNVPTVNARTPHREVFINLVETEKHKIVVEYNKTKGKIRNLKIRDKEKKRMLNNLRKKVKDELKEAIKKEKEEKGEFVKTPEMEKLEREEEIYGKNDLNMRNPFTIMHSLVKRGNRFNRRLARNLDEIVGEGYGSHVMNVITVLAMVIAGMIISNFVEGTWSGNFTLGFLMLGIATLLPKPQPIEDMGKVIMTYREAFKLWKHRKNNNIYGMPRSALKFFAVWFFITGARDATLIGFIGNIVMILVAAIAYFSFSSEFDQKVPGQIFEAMAKFFIGIIVIPWWVFYGIFQSLILGIMAMAFFAVPPVVKKSEEGESTIRGEYSRWIFAILMFIALVGSGALGDENILGMPTWGLTGGLKSTFLYFWLVTGIAGFFSPSASRPAIGFIMLSAATMIYAVGPGTQEVGSALLGPWFGKVYVSLTDVMAPVTDAFAQLGNTFGTAFQMLVNPVGFAQGIMSGTYKQDTDTGLVGAYGVEVSNFRATPIYANQPYSIIIPIENKGSTEAKNVKVTLLAGTGVTISKDGDALGTVKNLPKESKEWWEPIDFAAPDALSTGTQWSDLIRKSMHWEQFGFDKGEIKDLTTSSIKYECSDDKGCSANITRPLTKLDSEQVFFSSADTGVPCSSIVQFGLLTEKGSKFLPFTAVVSYDYSVESSLEIEAISSVEWSRLAQEGMLFSGIKKPSTMANSPVMLNIDSLEQPIREGTPFFIAFNLTPAIPGKGWIEEATVTLELPKELAKKATRCTTNPSGGIKTAKNTGIFKWEKRVDGSGKVGTFPTGQHAIYCYFSEMPVDEKSPTVTYYVNAYSEYRFNDVTTKAFALEFGGAQCCEKHEDCPGEFSKCTDNICSSGGGNGGEPTEPKMGEEGYCAVLIEKNPSFEDKCDLGMGGCSKDYECFVNIKYNIGNDVLSALKCWERGEIQGLEVGVCCPTEANQQQCRAVYDSWISGYALKVRINDLIDPKHLL